MIVKFVATDYEIAEPLGMRTGFSGRSEMGEHYLVITRSDGELGNPLPIDEVYSELDDQGGGGYGLLTGVQLYPDRLAVQFRRDRLGLVVDGRVEDVEGVEISFELGEHDTRRLGEALRRTLLGCEEYLTISLPASS